MPFAVSPSSFRPNIVLLLRRCAYCNPLPGPLLAAKPWLRLAACCVRDLGAG